MRRRPPADGALSGALCRQPVLIELFHEGVGHGIGHRMPDLDLLGGSGWSLTSSGVTAKSYTRIRSGRGSWPLGPLTRWTLAGPHATVMPKPGINETLGAYKGRALATAYIDGRVRNGATQAHWRVLAIPRLDGWAA